MYIHVWVIMKKWRYFKLQVKIYLMLQIFYSVKIKYLHKLIDKLFVKICNLKTQVVFQSIQGEIRS